MFVGVNRPAWRSGRVLVGNAGFHGLSGYVLHCCLPSSASMSKPAENKLIQSTLLLVEKAGAALDVQLRIAACKQARVQIREPPEL